MTIDLAKVTPLSLAYIGDAVYELAVREYLLHTGHVYNQLHKAAVEYVRAERQSALYDSISELLDEEEKTILRKGRNAKGGRQPNNVAVGAYRRATGVEALIGWLYLKGDEDKLMMIFDHLFEIESEEEENELQKNDK